MKFIYFSYSIYGVIGCKIEPVNTTTIVDGVYNIPYLPFSISTLKMHVTNLQREKIDIIFHPERSQNDEEYCCGFDNEKKGLRFSWGGGNEEGSKITLSKGQSKYAFIFVHHESSVLHPYYDLTLKVKKIMGLSEDETEEDQKQMRFYPIEDKKHITHNKIWDSDNGLTRMTFQGNLLGNYYPRWFPEIVSNINDNSKNGYYSEFSCPYIEIILERKSENYNNDRVLINFGKTKNIIALISGDMDGASFWVDMFKFHINSFIIRLWLYWLSKNQFRRRINLEVKEPDRGLSDPELPDLERYDFLVSTTGDVLCIGTDYHWKEYWYEPDSNRGTIEGIVRKYWHPPYETLAMLFARLSKVLDYNDIVTRLSRYIPTSKSNYSDSKKTVIESDLLSGLLVEKSISDANSKIERDVIKGEPKRWKNILRSHVPYVRNGHIIPDMVSKEVYIV